MNLQDLANIGELVGGLGVLVTLIYLAIQIRQNTATQRRASRLETTRAMTEWYSLVMVDPVMVNLFGRGFQEPESLSPDERARFLWLVGAFVSRVEEIYSQYEANLINEDLWFQYRGVVLSMLENAAVKEWWEARLAPFSSDFRAVIDASPPSDATWDLSKLHVMEGQGGNGKGSAA